MDLPQSNGSIDFQVKSSFDRDQRIGRFRPDYSAEQMLESINNNLIRANEQLRKELCGDSFPSIMITGVPRSGTTLLNQLLPSRYQIGYVSNLMARFYKAPLVGAWLQKQLIPEDIHVLREYGSEHGVTAKIFEPHEFGFFWSQYLRCADDCHEPGGSGTELVRGLSDLDRALKNTSRVFNTPVVYKSVVVPLFLQELLMNTDIFVVHVVRDKEEVIKSILKVREQRLGSRTKWWSVRPGGWDDMLGCPPEQQVAWQYDKINTAISSGLKGSEHRYIDCSFESLLENPEATLENIVKAYCAYSGFEPSKVGTPIVHL